MAVRAAVTHPAARIRGVAAGPQAATLPVLVRAAITRPAAVLLLVPSLARPAIDTSVTEPDASMIPAPCDQSGQPRRAVRPVQIEARPASRTPGAVPPATAGAGLVVGAVRGVAPSGMSGRSYVLVRTVNGGTRSILSLLR